MISRFCEMVLRALLCGIALILLAGIPACSDKKSSGTIDTNTAEATQAPSTPDDGAQIDPRSIGAERLHLPPCTATRRVNCAGHVPATNLPPCTATRRVNCVGRVPAPNSGRGGSWKTTGIWALVGLFVGLALFRIMRGSRNGQRPSLVPEGEGIPPQSGGGKEDEFNEWLGRNLTTSGDLTPETLSQLREQFQRERGNPRNG
jgi:hypothetical protein